MRRALGLLLLLPLSLAAPASAGAPAPLANFQTWAVAGSRVAFVATSAAGKAGYLWLQPFGGASPKLLRNRPPLGQEEIDQLAPGPRGSWGVLERAGGSLYTVSSRGGGAKVAGGGVQQVFGDGAFLGYVAGSRMFRVAGVDAQLVATLAGGTPQQVAVANGTIAVRETGGTVDVLTTSGKRLATIAANAASVALTANRVVVRTRTRRLAVYGLRGGLVHSWPLAATSWTAGLAAYGRYAVYLGANKAVHAVTIASGRDRVVARAGVGFYFNGIGLDAPGATVPLTTQRGKLFTTTLRFLPAATLG